MHNTGMERSETMLLRVNGRERGEEEMLPLRLQKVYREDTYKVLYDCRFPFWPLGTIEADMGTILERYMVDKAT